ncbi:protein of unknown function [Ralstonia solanacearum CFBP2957]|nr:protein of unknown function [Ralstonia solanacearum CFBP2957]
MGPWLTQAAPAPLASSKALCSGLPGRGLKAHLKLEHQRLRERADATVHRKLTRRLLARELWHAGYARRFSQDWYKRAKSSG